jgi:LuxR family transcriptional regulator, maltose regulon positive regulatory protein
MAQPKPMPITATALAAFNLRAELRALPLPSQGLACQPGAFLRCLNQAFLLTLVDSQVARIYGLLHGKHPVEIDLADCFIEDLDLSVLFRHAQPPVTQVRAILDQTPGWAFRQCLDLSLQISHSVQSALRHADAQVDRSANIPLSNEAFVELSSCIGHSIYGTHVTDHTAAALGESTPLHNGGGLVHTLRQDESVIDLRPDTSLPGHPAVGRTAFDRLSRGRANGLRRSHGEVAHWRTGGSETAHVAAGSPTGGQEELVGTPAWIRSLTVPHILAGAGGDVVRYLTELPEFAESEPLLLAAAAIARSRLDVAESAIHRAEPKEARPQPAEATELRPQPAEATELRPQPGDATELLNVALLKLAASSQRGDAGAGLAAASGLMDLVGRLTAMERRRAPELQPLIDYYVAGCEWSMGRLDTARSRLQIGAGSLERLQGLDEASVEQLVRANCAGRLAWLDAFCGNLRSSMRYATAVLTTRRADTAEIGVRFAQLATVLVHTERGEIEQAKQRLDHAISLSADQSDPLLAAAQLLTQVRLAMVTDGPSTVMRQLEPTASLAGNAITGWFAEQFTLATADAHLAAGEARRAISLLDSVPNSATGDAPLLLARAHRVAGNFSDAVAALVQTGSHSAVNTLVTEVRRWLLLAQLHAERNDIQVAGLLVDRALGAASSEALVETVRESDGWLRSFVARDSRLLVRHSGFLACLGYETAIRVPRRPEKSDLAGALIAVPLTTRETDVLNLLADYCSNEEIAADLVVSMNTVKTHIRSLFQKLSVTRRADAVRRGRALGLC